MDIRYKLLVLLLSVFIFSKCGPKEKDCYDGECDCENIVSETKCNSLPCCSYTDRLKSTTYVNMTTNSATTVTTENENRSCSCKNDFEFYSQLTKDETFSFNYGNGDSIFTLPGTSVSFNVVKKKWNMTKTSDYYLCPGSSVGMFARSKQEETTLMYEVNEGDLGVYFEDLIDNIALSSYQMQTPYFEVKDIDDLILFESTSGVNGYMLLTLIDAENGVFNVQVKYLTDGRSLEPFYEFLSLSVPVSFTLAKDTTLSYYFSIAENKLVEDPLKADFKMDFIDGGQYSTGYFLISAPTTSNPISFFNSDVSISSTDIDYLQRFPLENYGEKKTTTSIGHSNTYWSSIQFVNTNFEGFMYEKADGSSKTEYEIKLEFQYRNIVN